MAESGECSAVGCLRPARTRGWCTAHYQRWRKYGSVEPGSRTCRTCGVEFLSVRPRGHCTLACMRRDPQIAARQRGFALAHRVRNPRPYAVTCELCGVEAMVSAPDVKFCSHDCSVLWRMANPELDMSHRFRPRQLSASLELVHLGSLADFPDPRGIVKRQCRYCGGDFESERRAQKQCCSDRCRSSFLKYGRSRQFDDGRWWKFLVAGPCAWCGEGFVATASAPSHAPAYCTRRCQMAAGKYRHGRFIIPDHVRRAIYERDGWTCQLCNGPVDLTLSSSDPWGATLDHIVCQAWTDEPDHSPSNLRLAHRWCNSLRGDESHPEALTLFAN